MYRLKRYFITLYISFLTVVCIIAIQQLIQNNAAPWINIGLLIAAAPCLGFFIWLLSFRPPRTDSHPLAITLSSAVGVVIVMLSQNSAATAQDNHSFWLAAFSFIGWYTYLRWYSRLPDPDLSHLKQGNVLPRFELENVEGQRVSSEEFTGHPHIFLFYRGNWCPLCVGQIQEVAAQWREIEQRGARVILISPQSQSHTQDIAKRFDTPMQFMRDVDNQAAQRLGIAAPGGLPLGMELFGYDADVVLPTVIITKADGTIHYAHVTDNYRVRPEPDHFIKLLDQIEANATP